MVADCAANRPDALARLAEGSPLDAVIIDLQLPDQDGLALANEIRQLPAGRNLPLLLLSSIRLRSDDPRPAGLGISVFIHKPIRPAQLLDALCRALNIQLQREKKAPPAPSLDTTFARRIPLRVLLADDNPINQKVGLSVLQKLGYRADLAGNGLEVLRALEQRPYDLLLLDVQMPEMDGLEAARRICERWTRDKRPCIVAMTGNALMGDREKCLAAGMDDYITKPVRIGELQSILERWGPSRFRATDTAFLPRAAVPAVENLLDQTIRAELREMSDAKENILRELVDLFLQSAPQTIAQINQFINDPPQLAFHAHAMKSMSLNLGAKRMVELSQKLEELGRSGNVDDASELLRELEVAYSQTKAHLIPLRDQ
jgi:CheY-like chemotaxis protein/HPt (histidine-containing phosphotransfer) domain-containing protein